MRILILGTDVFSKGGIQRYTRYQYSALRESYGCNEVFLFSLSPQENLNRFESPIDVSYVGTGIGLASKIRYVLTALRFVKKNQIDVIICTHVNLSVIGFLARSIFGLKYYVNVYGLEIWSGLKKSSRFGLHKADGVIGDCNFILSYIREKVDYVGMTSLLYDPVDTEKFRPLECDEGTRRKFGIKDDSFVLMTVGRLERNKGHELVIRSLPNLPPEVIYVIVGGGKYEDQYRKVAEEEGVTERVIFLGRVSDEEIVQAYSSANIVVLLSVFSENEGEGLPLGLIEASACGKPIVCGNQDGSAEAIYMERVNGVSIDPTNQSDFIAAIETYIRDKQLEVEHGEAGRQFVENKLDYHNFKESLIGILEDANGISA